MFQMELKSQQKTKPPRLPGDQDFRAFSCFLWPSPILSRTIDLATRRHEKAPKLGVSIRPQTHPSLKRTVSELSPPWSGKHSWCPSCLGGEFSDQHSLHQLTAAPLRRGDHCASCKPPSGDLQHPSGRFSHTPTPEP